MVSTLVVATVALLPYLAVANYQTTRARHSIEFDLAQAIEAGGLADVSHGDAGSTKDDEGRLLYLTEARTSFVAEVPDPQRVHEYATTLRFRPDLNGGQQFSVGVVASDRNVTWTTAYGPVLQGLATQWKEVARDGHERLYASDPDQESLAAPNSVTDPPLYTRITSADGRYDVTSPAPEELPVLHSKDAAGVAAPTSSRVRDLPVALKGDFELHFYALSTNVSLLLKVLDLNRGRGEDAFNVTLAALDGSTIKDLRVEDDGDVAADHKLHTRNVTLSANVDRGTWYVLKAKNTGPDIVFDQIHAPGVKLFPQRLTLAGPDVAGHAAGPVNVNLRTDGGNLTVEPLRDTYASVLQALHAHWRLIAKNTTDRVYAIEPRHPPVQLNEFLERPPLYAGVASSEGLFHPQSPAPNELHELAGVTAPPFPTIDAAAPADTPIGLRGATTAEFYTATGDLSLRFTVRDLNAGAGSDAQNITLKHLNGTAIQTLSIPDDGRTDTSKQATLRAFYLNATVPEDTWYILETRGASSDLQFENYVLPRPAVFVKALSLGGAWYGTHQSLPVDIALHTNGANLTATATSTVGRQRLVIRDADGHERTLNVNQASTPFTLALPAGDYVVNVRNGSLQLALSEGFLGFGDGPLQLPRPRFVEDDGSGLSIREPLRGDHTFWTYVQNGDLEVGLTKRDTNNYLGDDALQFTVTDAAGVELANTTLDDDGDVSKAGGAGPSQSATLHLTDLAPGSYRIATHGSGDYRLRDLHVNQGKLVAESLFLLGYNTCCFKTQQMDNQIDVYYDAFSAGTLTAMTPHALGLQTLRVFGPNAPADTPNATVHLADTGVAYNVPTAGGQPVRVNVPAQDVQLTGHGFFSFTPESFFFPIRQAIVPFKNDAAYLQDNARYVHVSTKGYESVYETSDARVAWIDPHTLKVDNPRSKVTIPLAKGSYKLTLTNASAALGLTDGFFSFDPAPLPEPRPAAVRTTTKGIEVMDALRGNHVLWTYVEGGTLDLRLVKQDLNFRPDDDNLRLELTDVGGRLIAKTEAPDADGASAKLGPRQSLRLQADGLATGSYRVTMNGSGDYLVRSLSLNQQRLVAETVYPVGYSGCCFKSDAIDNGLDLYYDSMVPGDVTAATGHSSGVQEITYNRLGNSTPIGNLTLTQAGDKDAARLGAREPIHLFLERQNVELRGPGFFAFTPESFFFPYRHEVVKYRPDLEYLRSNADYVRIPTGGFEALEPADEDGFYTWTHVWDADEIGLKDARFTLHLQVSGFDRPDSEGKTVYFREPKLATREALFLVDSLQRLLGAS